MKLARVGPRGAEIPAVVTDGGLLDARSVTADFGKAFWSDHGADRLRAALEADRLPAIEGAETLRVGAPVPQPGALICIGMNYAAHAAESGATPPEVPIIFLKTPNTVVGPYDEVAIPRGSTKTDWEVELGVVIGKRATYLDSPEQALEHVAGYVVANDLSERDFQIAVSGGQWSKGKCCPGFSPLGPWLVTADEVDAQSLTLRSWVNGEPRQDSTTADQIFPVAEIVHHLSQYLVLDAGDVILTGTPEGVALSGRFPYLAEGDVVELEIEGLGRQRQLLVSHTKEGA